MDNDQKMDIGQFREQYMELCDKMHVLIAQNMVSRFNKTLDKLGVLVQQYEQMDKEQTVEALHSILLGENEYASYWAGHYLIRNDLYVDESLAVMERLHQSKDLWVRVDSGMFLYMYERGDWDFQKKE